MNARRLLLGLTGAMLLAGCAPVSPPTAVETSTADDKPIEIIQIKPREVENKKPTGPDSRIEAAIKNVRRRDLLTTNGFWTIFHGILGMGFDTTLMDPNTGARINAIDHIASGGELRGLRFLPTKHGLDVQTGPVMVGQGHQDQFVAEMIQWGIKPDRKFVVLGKDYTFMDFVRHSQMQARTTTNQELSWALIVVGQHMGTDVSWVNEHGESLRYEDMLRYELDQSMDKAACGGTHRLFGLSWALHLHVQRGGKVEGIWKEVKEFTDKHKALAKKYQNGDGTFSTDSFKGPASVNDPVRRINTTGHILEWLALAMTDEEIRQPWVQDAADALAMLILDFQDESVEGGSLYHAVHGLIMYHARLYDPAALARLKEFVPFPPEGLR